MGMFGKSSKPNVEKMERNKIMGFNPEKIRQLLEAEKFDLGTLHPKVLGASVESIKIQFNSPTS